MTLATMLTPAGFFQLCLFLGVRTFSARWGEGFSLSVLS
jgi:hypothetical protein